MTFSQANWYQLLQNNYQAKTNLTATLTVDGVVYEGVGVRLRGNTSYQMTGNSQKKSFNIEIDYADPNQRLMGYEILNLLKWQFPEGTQLGPNGYLAAWADEDGAMSRRRVLFHWQEIKSAIVLWHRRNVERAGPCSHEKSHSCTSS